MNSPFPKARAPKVFGLNLTADCELTRLNTMGLSSTARVAVELTRPEQIPTAVDLARLNGLPLWVMGGGSNLLLAEKVPALVALMRIGGRAIDERTDGRAFVTVGGGEDWPSLVEWTVSQGLCGLERLAGVPGTMGAAPIQNIGAYGAELADVLIDLVAYDIHEAAWRTLSAQDCRFSYRHSLFKEQPGRFIVSSVRLALRRWGTHLPGQAPNVVMEEVLALRAAKLPDWRILGNAGSFFHNPLVASDIAESIRGAPAYPQPDGRVKLSAGWLIERCGLKGARRGPVGVYDGHALVLVNHGGGTLRNVLDLAEEIREAVRLDCGIDLVREPALWR